MSFFKVFTVVATMVRGTFSAVDTSAPDAFWKVPECFSFENFKHEVSQNHYANSSYMKREIRKHGGNTWWLESVMNIRIWMKRGQRRGLEIKCDRDNCCDQPMEKTYSYGRVKFVIKRTEIIDLSGWEEKPTGTYFYRVEAVRGKLPQEITDDSGYRYDIVMRLCLSKDNLYKFVDQVISCGRIHDVYVRQKFSGGSKLVNALHDEALEKKVKKSEDGYESNLLLLQDIRSKIQERLLSQLQPMFCKIADPSTASDQLVRIKKDLKEILLHGKHSHPKASNEDSRFESYLGARREALHKITEALLKRAEETSKLVGRLTDELLLIQ